jgi:integrase/recombinase XerD
VCAFFLWGQWRKIHDLSNIRSHHVAGYIERLGQTHAPPSVKQHLAAIRMLFDWLVVGQIVTQNPARAVRGPTYVVKKGKTPVLLGEEARALLDSIPAYTPVRLRDRAFISLLVYTFARVHICADPQGSAHLMWRDRLDIRYKDAIVAIC